MADSEVQAHHQENHASEKPIVENGANGNGHDDHGTNGTATNGDAKQVVDASNGDAGTVKVGETPAESSPAKPKRTGSRVKDIFSRIFKRGKSKDANDQSQNGETPKKEKTKKEKGGKKQPEVAANVNDSAVAATTETETDAAHKPTENHDHEDVKLSAQTESKLKIEDCVDTNTNGHVDVKEKIADEKAGEKCTEQVGGDEEKRNDEKHDC